MEFASHLGKKLILPGLLDGMLYELDIQNPQKNDYWSCLKNVRQFFYVADLWKSLPAILQDTEESDWKLLIQVELSLKVPSSWKSLLDTMVLQA